MIKRKIIAICLIIAMMFTMMPVMGNVYAAEEDTRIPVNAVTATTPSGSFPPVYGAEVSRLIFTSEQADFPLNMGDWQKKVDGVWINVAPGTTFTEGTYRYEAQVRIDEVSPLSGDEYVIEPPCTVTVNGVSWTTMTNRGGGIGFSYGWTESPEYIIERPADAPLVFAEYTEYINSYDRIAIDEINLASHVSGGEGAYTFSKISGPSWINVSGNGVITGTPTTVGSNDNLVVRVTDEANTYREITILVEKTKMNPGDRIKVSSITASTASGSIRPMYGDTVSIPNFISDVAFPQHMGDWQKKVGEEWVDITNGTTFTEGTYRYWAQVRIDETSTLPGDKYVLGDSCTVTVNGVAWTTMTSPAVGNTYSYNHSISPEYVVLNPGNLQYGEVVVNDTSLIYDGSEKRPSVTVKDLNDKVLVQDVDYTVSYENNVNIGTGKVIVTGIGDYSGTKETSFTISMPVFSSAVLSETSFVYDRTPKEPSVVVKNNNDDILTEGVDYTVSYVNNINIGTGKVIVTGIGDYSFSKELTFKINMRNLLGTSKVSAKLYGYDDIKVSWNKVSGATGYYVYYKRSTSTSWSAPKYVTGTSIKLANLYDGYKYYVRVYPCVKDTSGKIYRDGSYNTSSGIYTLKKITGVKAIRSGSKVKVSWSNINGESGYQISRSTKSTGTYIVKTYSTTVGKYYKVSAAKGKTYYYKVRAYKTVDGKKIYGPWSIVKKYRR